MPIRTTVDIPEPLHELLCDRRRKSGASIRSLIIRAIEQSYSAPTKGQRLTGPMLTAKGKLGRRFPKDQNLHDLVFS